MSDQDTQDTRTTARSTLADRPGPRLPPLKKKRPKKDPPRVPGEEDDRLWPIGVGESFSSGHQDTSRVQRVGANLGRIVRWWRPRESGGVGKIGPKGQCPILYSGAPEEAGSALATNFPLVHFGFGDFERNDKTGLDFVPDEESVTTIREVMAEHGSFGIGSSSSHDPAGLHPDEAKRGLRRIRTVWRWSRPATPLEHRRGWLVLHRRIAERSGHEGLPEPRGWGDKLYSALRALGCDASLSKASQPIYPPRWKTDDLKSQAFAEIVIGERGSIELDDLLAEWIEDAAEPNPDEDGIVPQEPVDLGSIGPVGPRLERLRRVIQDWGYAVSGRSGRDTTWGICLRGARGLLLSWEEAATIMLAWDRGCTPPWGEEALKKTWDDASHARTPAGFLLGGLAAGSTPPFKRDDDPPQGRGGSSSLSPAVDSDDPIAERVHRRYLTPVTLADLDRIDARVWVRDSECGTGKNFTLKPCFRDLRDGEVAFHISYRESLGWAGAATFEIACYKTLGGEIKETAAICVDSTTRIDLAALLARQDPDLADLHHPKAGQSPIRFTIWDECDSLIRHLDGKTIREKGLLGSVYSQVQALAQMSGLNILQADGAVEVGLARRAFQRFLGDAWSERLQVNTYRRSRKFLRYLGGHSHLEAQLLEDVRATVNGESSDFRFVPCSTKGRAHRLAQTIRDKVPGARVWEITADTDDLEENKALLADLSLLGTRHVLVYSPVLNDGVSLEHLPGETYSFQDAGQWTSTWDAWQAIHRGRDVGVWHVAIEGHADGGPSDPDDVYEQLTRIGADQYDRLKDISSWTLKYDPKTGALRLHPDNDGCTRMVADARAHENRERDLQTRFWALVEAREGEIVDVEDPLSKEEKIAIAREHKALIAAAASARRAAVLADPVRSEGEIEGLRSESGTPEAQAALAAASIRRRYGVEEIDPDLYDRDQARGRWAAVKLLQHLEALEDGEDQAVARLERLDFAGEALHVGARESWKQVIMVRRILANFGIDRIRDALDHFMEFEPLYPLDGVNSWDADRILGITPKMTASQVLGQVCERLGLSRKYQRPRGEDGTRRRIYSITAESYATTSEDGAAYRRRLRMEETRSKLQDCPEHPHGLDGEEILPCILPTTSTPAANDFEIETSTILEDLEHSGAVALLHAEPHRRLYQARRPCRCGGVDLDPDHLIVLLREGDGWGAVVGIGIGGRTHSDQIYAHAERVREATA